METHKFHDAWQRSRLVRQLLQGCVGPREPRVDGTRCRCRKPQIVILIQGQSSERWGKVNTDLTTNILKMHVNHRELTLGSGFVLMTSCVQHVSALAPCQ